VKFRSPHDLVVAKRIDAYHQGEIAAAASRRAARTELLKSSRRRKRKKGPRRRGLWRGPICDGFEKADAQAACCFSP
jgi:hypothetical protein